MSWRSAGLIALLRRGRASLFAARLKIAIGLRAYAPATAQ
jgi:hypothetical protein